MALVSTETRIEADINFSQITMHNEGKFNPDSLGEFNNALDSILVDESIQCLVITGEEKTFAQGFDLNYLGSEKPDTVLAFVETSMVMVGRLLRSPIPVISAVNGHAFGLGAMLVLASDYAVMREDRGFFCLPEIDLGMNLVPSMNALVKDKLSAKALRELLLTGKRVAAPEAVEFGFVDQSCALEQLISTALSIAQPMLGKDRNALSGLKTGINKDILSFIQ